MPRPLRARRSCLSVPGSSERFLTSARSLPVDEVMLDLEDSVAPAAKPDARRLVLAALRGGDWGERVRAVRVNGWATAWTYADVVAVVEGAGWCLDCVVLPKVRRPAEVVALDLLLGQVEEAAGLERGRIGIEAQIEDAAGLANVERIAASSDRLEALVFGPADFMASLGMRSLTVGAQLPGYDVGDAYHYALLRILVAARARGLQAVDGPWPALRDVEGFRRAATRTAALGYDGKWVLHPAQVEAANQIYAPAQQDYDRAEDILDAYAQALSDAGGRRGAVMLGDEMIDEATRKLAEVVAGKGRRAGLLPRGGGAAQGSVPET